MPEKLLKLSFYITLIEAIAAFVFVFVSISNPNPGAELGPLVLAGFYGVTAVYYVLIALAIYIISYKKNSPYIVLISWLLLDSVPVYFYFFG
ncbi:hypothetical protein HQ865_09740 [Mucilaginibacter mali]|uniref:Uncharacterized protein n=1 Tax=Mucilaginibacter mali TaxID=2740462 RepID=A0A7D4Q0T2_9SPHI|nr:hypothetical protein [Mucilaginibacter mali]QKJ30026.1 hypothetical protein HQ865_09740 [Mucilaginibacter mali]